MTDQPFGNAGGAAGVRLELGTGSILPHPMNAAIIASTRIILR
jgi:hypothetical protein